MLVNILSIVKTKELVALKEGNIRKFKFLQFMIKCCDLSSCIVEI